MKSRLAVPLALCLFLIPACGTGGADGPGTAGGTLPPEQVALAIDTTVLPDGSTLAPYAATQIETSGADGPTTFRLQSGDLPPGLTLSESGVVSGQPTSVGVFTFEVEATDGTDVASQTFDVPVTDTFALLVGSGLVGSDAWSGSPVTLRTVGATGTVTFSVVSAASGGLYTVTNGAAGTATWLPGTTLDVDDVLEAFDAGTGLRRTVTIPVVENPAPDQVADFGNTDVWYVSTDVKNGTHGHRSDFLQALSEVGLLPAGTGSDTPTQLETVMDAAVRLSMLRELNLIFLRDAGGAKGSNGLDISFPFFAPDPTLYTAPSETGQLSGGVARFSIMECADVIGGSASVLGRAIYDVSNPDHDHDGGADPFDGARLGCFINNIQDSFSSWQGDVLLTSSPLTGDPVTAADQSIVEDILYGRATTGSRHDEIEELIVYFSRALALVVGHEIGHSIGLDHNGGGQFLMASSIGFGDSSLSSSNAVPLRASEITTLRDTNLPGAGRTTSLFARSKPAPARGPRRILEFHAQP